jgi:hypothetical protein
MGPNTAAMFMNVPLAKRVNHLIEWSGSGILLDMASAALSLLTVFTYMVCLCLQQCCAHKLLLTCGGAHLGVTDCCLHTACKQSVYVLQVETGYTEYDPIWQRLRVVDQVCSAIFAAEWCFWLWLARDRLG